MSMGKGGQVAGYRYFMGLHFGLCHGPIDDLVEVRAGDLAIWNGSKTVSGAITLNKPELYGGDKGEGGVKGTLDVMMGEPAQDANSYLALMQGALQSAYRGICTLVFRGGQIGSNNPYPKPWSFRVRRAAKGWDGPTWYSAKAIINMTGAGIELQIGHPLTIDLPNNTLLTFNSGTASGYSIGDSPAGGQQINAIITSGTPSIGMLVTDAVGAIPGGTLISDMTGSSIKGMNPAHIIYETLTNRNWGMGYPSSIIDNTAFTAAADQLYTEGFGLCLLWQRTDSIEAFLQQVVDHCGAVLVQSRTTGLFQLNLIRGGYDVGTLPVFGPDNVVQIISYESPSITGLTNEIVITWFDPTTKSKQTTTVQHLGAIQSQGVVVSASKEYAGISTSDLAGRVSQRDLRATAIPLKRLQAKLDRNAYAMLPGGLFVLNFPDYGIDSMVFRIGDVDYGTLEDGSITITALQDVFALPTTSFIAPPQTGWALPDGAPHPPAYALAMDATYRDLARNLTQQQLKDVQELGGYVAFLASKPTGLSLGYEFWTRVGAADYKRFDNGFFCPNGILQASIQPFDTAITIELGVDLEIIPTLPCAAIIEDEIVSVTALDTTTGVATIARGCVDTVPTAHSAGVRIWLYDNFLASDQVEYFDNEDVDLQPLTYAPSGTLKSADATTYTSHIVNRQNLPYAPAYLTLNGVRWDLATTVTGTITIAWRQRNRLTQMDKLVDQTQATVAPEVGTSYSVKITSQSTGQVVASAVGLTGTTFSFTPTQADSFDLELWSMRAGLASLQKQVASFGISGGSFRRITEFGPDRITESGSPRDIMVTPPPPPPPAPPPTPTAPSLTHFNEDEAAPTRTGNRQVVFYRWAGRGSGWNSDNTDFIVTIKRHTAAGTITWNLSAETYSDRIAPQSYDQVSINLAVGGAVIGSAYEGGINYWAAAAGLTSDVQAYQRFPGSPPSDWCEGFSTIDGLFQNCFVLPVGVRAYQNTLPSAPMPNPGGTEDWIEYYAYTVPNLGGGVSDPASYFTDNTIFVAFPGRNFVDTVTTARPQLTAVVPWGVVMAGQIWTVTLAGAPYVYTSVPGDFLQQVCEGLAAVINAGGVYTADAELTGPQWRTHIAGIPGTSYSVATSVV